MLERKDLKEESTISVPKVIHCIWFGSVLPQQYQANIITMVKTNPDYKVMLWSDALTMKQEDYKALQTFCEKTNVVLTDIRTQKEMRNYDLVIGELDASLKTTTHRRIHFVRASDIARIAILYQQGGIYIDTDTRLLTFFPDLVPHHGFYLKLSVDPTGRQHNYHQYKMSNQTGYDFYHILYDFMACVPQHPLFDLAIKITQLDYEQYRKSKNKKWEHSQYKNDLTYTTVKLTGSSLKYALNYLYQSNVLTLQDPMAIFLNTDALLSSSYDKSWLQDITLDHDESKKSDERDAVCDLFIDEVDDNRMRHYPTVDYAAVLRKEAILSQVSSAFFNKGKQDEALAYVSQQAAKIISQVQAPFTIKVDLKVPEFKLDLSNITFPVKKH